MLKAQSSLRLRLIVVALVAIAPVLAFSTYYSYLHRHKEEATVREQLVRIVSLVAQEQNDAVAPIRSMLADLSTRLAAIDIENQPDCEKVLEQWLRERPDREGARVANAQGKAVCYAGRAPFLASVADREWFIRTTSRRAFSAGVYQLDVDQIPRIIFGYPIIDPHGTLRGTVSTALELPRLAAVTGRQWLPSGGIVALADRRGTVLARSDSSKFIGQPVAKGPLFSKLMSGGESAFFDTLDGQPYIYACKQVPGADQVRAIVWVPRSTYLAEDDATYYFSLGLLLIVPPIAVLFASLASSWLVVRPISPIISAIKTLGAGDLSARTGFEDKHGEIGKLGAAFDRMAASIQSQQADRDSAEAAVREREARYRLLFDSNPQAMWVFDKGTLRFLAVNDAAIARYGYSRNEFLAKQLPDVFHPDFKEQGAQIARNLPEGIARVGIFRHAKKNGGVIDVEVVSHSIEFAGRRAQLSLITEVTDRLRAEHALIESERRYREMADALPDGIFEIDRNGAALFMNRTGLEMLGRDVRPSPEVRLTAFDVVPESERPRVRAAIDEVIGTGQPVMGEYTLVRANGTSFPAVVHASPILADDGQAVGLRGVFVDISSRKRAERELLEAETKYRSLVANAGYGISRTTLDDRFLEVNPALVAMHGYESAEQLLATPVSQLFRVPAERKRFIEHVMRAKGGFVKQEAELLRRDGSVMVARFNSRAAISESGVVVETFVDDITRERMLAEQFRQAQKMEAVGRLAGGVAHDFNNLLTSILGYSDLVLSSTDVKPEIRKDLDQIVNAAQSAASLTQQLLAFSRKQILQPKILSLNEVVVTTEKILRRVIGEDITLVTKTASDLERVRADRGQLQQIVMNLVVNARDAMPNGGEIVIETSNTDSVSRRDAEGGAIPDGRYVLLTVADNGSGMSEAVRQRVFEPFFTTKEHGKGTGLGLSTVYGIVKQSGGFIGLETHVGVGTRWSIFLPSVGRHPSDRRQAETQPQVQGAGTILLVEDEPGVRSLAARILRSAGYGVVEAASAAAALQVLESASEKDFSLLLTDVVMPGGSGPELVNAIAGRWGHLPVVYMSGYASDAKGLEQLSAEGANFIKKPFTPAELRAIVLSALKREEI